MSRKEDHTSLQPTGLTRSFVIKLLIVLLVLSGISFASSIIFQPDGTKPERLLADKPTDYFNAAFSFRHSNDTVVSPKYTRGSLLDEDGVPIYILVKVPDIQDGKIEIFVMQAGEDMSKKQLASRLPVQIYKDAMQKQQVSVAGRQGTQYDLVQKSDHEDIPIQGVWLTAPYKGTYIALDIRMSTPLELSAEDMNRLRLEFDQIIHSLVVHTI